jgi:hypothetical protein
VETLYDVDCVERIVRYFLEGRGDHDVDEEGSEAETPGREASRRAMLPVGRLMDAYLGEIATDANLKTDKFCDLAWALPDSARVYDDGLYRAVDIYIKVKEHILNVVSIFAAQCRCSEVAVLCAGSSSIKRRREGEGERCGRRPQADARGMHPRGAK